MGDFTYLGGGDRGDTRGKGIAVDRSGNAYVTGFTNSGVLITPGAFQVPRSIDGNYFVSKFSFGVPFCSLKSRLELDVDGDRDDGFGFGARFALGAGGSIDPTTQPVTLTIASYSVTIPSGSFVKRHRSYEFAGRINGVRLAVLIRRHHREWWDRDDDEDNDNDGRDHHDQDMDHHTDGGDHDRCTTATYTLLAKARGNILKGTTNPVAVTISIGDNTRTTQVHARFER
jgi:Beta-propeller repeat